MTYEERLNLMGLQPFEKCGFPIRRYLNQRRKESLDFIDQFPKVLEYKVSDCKGIKLWGFKDKNWVEPLLILAEDNNIYYVFNGIYTYSFPKDLYKHYEIYDKYYNYSNEDGFI